MRGEDDTDAILESTIPELVERNGAELLASLLQSEVRAHRDLVRRHSNESRRLLGHLDEAQRVGRRVLKAQVDGRKTVRIAEVVDS